MTEPNGDSASDDTRGHLLRTRADAQQSDRDDDTEVNTAVRADDDDGDDDVAGHMQPPPDLHRDR